MEKSPLVGIVMGSDSDLPVMEEAEKISPGLNPYFGDPENLAIDVETPSGEVLDIADPGLARLLTDGLSHDHSLTLVRSDRAITDCRPVSLFSLQTLTQLGEEIGATLDARRFRANIYIDLGSAEGFAEDAFVGKTLQLGRKVEIAVLERDPRCKMITLDPDTAEMDPKVLQKVGRAHKGMAGVYAAVLIEGTVAAGDEIRVSD